VDDRDWDEFCAASPSAWLWHTTAWREYTLNYRPELQSESRAFGVYDEGRLVAVVPLMIERDEDGWAFTFGGAACWSPALAPDLSPTDAQALFRRCLEHVDELAAKDNARRGAFAVSPLVPNLPGTALQWVAAAVRAGYLDVTRASQVMDLTDADDDALLRSMTKGHRAAVK